MFFILCHFYKRAGPTALFQLSADTSCRRHLVGLEAPTYADCAVPSCHLKHEHRYDETGLISISTRFLVFFEPPHKKVTQKVTTFLKMANLAQKSNS